MARRTPVGLIGALVCVGCIRTSAAPTVYYWLSSDSSQYSPVARFRVTTELVGNDLRVRLDSGSLTIPGVGGVTAPPLMSDLFLTAMVVVGDSSTMSAVEGARGRRAPDRRGWRPIGTSDSTLISTELRYGERQPVRPVSVIIPRLPNRTAVPWWLVVRVSGNTIELSAPAVVGGQPRRRDLRGGVQVYVCGNRDVFGQVDAERGAALKLAYGLVC